MHTGVLCFYLFWLYQPFFNGFVRYHHLYYLGLCHWHRDQRMIAPDRWFWTTLIEPWTNTPSAQGIFVIKRCCYWLCIFVSSFWLYIVCSDPEMICFYEFVDWMQIASLPRQRPDITTPRFNMEIRCFAITTKRNEQRSYEFDNGTCDIFFING